MKTLRLGGMCSDFSCAKCCRETAMFLSREDITRLEGLGYEAKEFCTLTDDGFYELTNIDGSCYFLKNNKCTVYESRPQGCRFYPIIFDLESNKATLDKDCPLINTISSSTVISFTKDLRKFINKLLNEKEK